MRLDHRLQRFRVLPIDRNSNNPYLDVTLSSHSNRMGRIAALPSLIHREGWGERSAATTAFAPCCCNYPSLEGSRNYGKHEFSETASTLHVRLLNEYNLIVDWIARVSATGKGLGNRDEPTDT